MARRLVWMPVLPRVTVSDALNLRGRGLRVRARARWGNAAWRSQTAPAAQAERKRNSRRFKRPPQKRLFRRWYSYYGRMAACGGYQTLGGFIEQPRPLLEGRERRIAFTALRETGFQR